MDAGQVAGLLVLLGVVGVLAAIVGAGIQAGPVKFPSIPSSRQRPLAVVSVLVVAGAATWWAIARQADTGSATPQTSQTSATPPSGGLRVLLTPSSGNIRVGQELAVASYVGDASGQTGNGQCVMTWKDRVAGRVVHSDTTDCDATFRWTSARPAGVHRITASAEGIRGAEGTASKTVQVTVMP
jgi:hypothetical protein